MRGKGRYKRDVHSGIPSCYYVDFSFETGEVVWMKAHVEEEYLSSSVLMSKARYAQVGFGIEFDDIFDIT